jgi:hypothetical protein
MAFYVYGKAPVSDSGREFYQPVWQWHPLVWICHEIAPTIVNETWHFNSKVEVEKALAHTLADVLEAHMDTMEGRCWRLTRKLLSGTPICPICGTDGSIKMTDEMSRNNRPLAVSRSDHRKGTVIVCPVCYGLGYVSMASSANYVIEKWVVQRFATFCKNSGGFMIT